MTRRSSPTPITTDPEHPVTLPRTELDALLAHRVGTRLDLDPGSLARHLPLLDEVVATTANGSALISDLAAYAEPSFAGEAFAVRTDRVVVRLARSAVAEVVRTDADDGAREPAGLWMFGADGAAVHRAHLVSGPAPTAPDLMARVPRAGRTGAVPPVPPVLPEPGELDQIGLLDAVLADDGDLLDRIARPAFPVRGFLPVVELLCLLCEHGVPAGVAVPNRGCLQASVGWVDHVETGDVVGVVSGAARFAFGPAEVDAARVVRTHGPHGPMSTVLLTGDDGRCLALLGQLGLPPVSAVTAWERMVADVFGGHGFGGRRRPTG
jgi:putative heme degradation protein